MDYKRSRKKQKTENENENHFLGNIQHLSLLSSYLDSRDLLNLADTSKKHKKTSLNFLYIIQITRTEYDEYLEDWVTYRNYEILRNIFQLPIIMRRYAYVNINFKEHTSIISIQNAYNNILNNHYPRININIYEKRIFKDKLPTIIYAVRDGNDFVLFYNQDVLFHFYREITPDFLLLILKTYNNYDYYNELTISRIIFETIEEDVKDLLLKYKGEEDRYENNENNNDSYDDEYDDEDNDEDDESPHFVPW